MKKCLFLFIILGGSLLSSCFDEDKIHVDTETYKRAYDTTSTDPVWKYVSQYFYKFDKLFITDPDSSDYLFNFQYKYELWMQKPEQTTEHLLAGINFVNEMLLDGFSDDFKKNYFPYSIIIADSIVYTGGGENGWKPKTINCTRYHVSLLVSNKTLSMSEEKKVELSQAWNLAFLLDYCAQYGGGFNIPQEFYDISKEFRGRYKGEHLPKEEWYERGFLSVVEFGFYKPWWGDEPGYDYTDFPSMDSSDFEYFFRSMLSIPYDELQEIAANYPRVKARLELIDNELRKIGIDYKNMGYKAKK